MMQWKKPADMHYTDLCIYIDENITKIATPGVYPEIENKIYNYLWLLVKALAIKKCMFTDFKDYDPYAFYAANRLFFALRKNQLNQGKTIKGKLIRPIKSCLNYTKALLYPMKVEYQRETYREIIDEEFVSKKFDAFSFKEQMMNSTRQSQDIFGKLQIYVNDTINETGTILDKILTKLPFTKDSVDYHRIKLSILLATLNTLKQKNKLVVEPTQITTWKLPKSMNSYLKVLLKEFYAALATELMDCCKEAIPDDDTIDKILTYREGNDYEYEE